MSTTPTPIAGVGAFPYPAQPFTPKRSLGGNTSGWQGVQYGNEQADRTNRDTLVGQNEGILGFASGNPTDSPLYKSLLTHARESIGNSYDAAVRNTRASSAARGFGYASPNVEGSEASLRGSEAGAMSAAPGAALMDTIPVEMQAADIGSREAGMYSQSADANMGYISSLAQARMKKSSDMTGHITQLLGDMSKAAGTAYAG